MGKKDKNKFYFFKIDKDKVKLHLHDIGSKIIPGKNKWRYVSILISFMLLIGIVIAVYTNDGLDEKSKNFAEPEIQLNYESETEEDNPSEPAVVYDEEKEFELSSQNIKLRSDSSKDQTDSSKAQSNKGDLGKNNERTNVRETTASNKSSSVIKEEYEKTYPVGPSPAQERVEKISEIIKPVSGNIIRKPGWIFHPLYEDWRYQPGVILEGKSGAIVSAVSSGKVVSANQDIYYGIEIVIEHKQGVQTVYGNLKQAEVVAGEQVNTGQNIGKIGDKGLYFELYQNGNPLNPEEFF